MKLKYTVFQQLMQVRSLVTGPPALPCPALPCPALPCPALPVADYGVPITTGTH